jgi:hypothetical protein
MPKRPGFSIVALSLACVKPAHRQPDEAARRGPVMVDVSRALDQMITQGAPLDMGGTMKKPPLGVSTGIGLVSRSGSLSQPPP